MINGSNALIGLLDDAAFHRLKRFAIASDMHLLFCLLIHLS